MENLKRKFLKATNQFLAICISLLGFSSFSLLSGCLKPENQVDYGSPMAKFIVKGVVQSGDSNAAIPNVRVIMRYDTSYSDANGNYQVETSSNPSSQSFYIKFTDVDGANNREFIESDTLTEFTDPKFTGGSGSWNYGQTEKQFNIKLKPKK
jgi:putative lipoprotein (rSAM/lipoprotein system)